MPSSNLIWSASAVVRDSSKPVAWASTAANETPLRFHEGAGLWLGALAIGRRLYVHTPWRQRVFPNLYIMSVAVSTYYRKSAGLNLAHDMARGHAAHDPAAAGIAGSVHEYVGRGLAAELR